MWLFAKRGFFSIVQDKDDPEYLIVRARVKGDIERYWPLSTVERHDDRDYLYRARIDRRLVARGLSVAVDQIDYVNFKTQIEDKKRSPWYLQVWETMWDMQESFKRKGTTDGEKD